MRNSAMIVFIVPQVSCVINSMKRMTDEVHIKGSLRKRRNSPMSHPQKYVTIPMGYSGERIT